MNTVAMRAPTLSTSFLGFNVDNQPMADERVRRAIAHAIDRAALLADSPGVDQAVERGGAIPPVMPGHGDNVAVQLRPRGARARCSPRPAIPAVRACPRSSSRRRPRRRRRRSCRQLAEIGVRTRIETSSRWHAASPPTCTSSSRPGTPTTPTRTASTSASSSSTCRSTATTRRTRCSRRARASRDRDERLRLYREFERLWIGQRVAIVPLSYARQLLLRRPHVQSLRLNPMRVFHLEQVVVDQGAQTG